MGRRGKNQWRLQKAGRRPGGGESGEDEADVLPSSAYEPGDREEGQGEGETAEDEEGDERGEEGGGDVSPSKFHLYQKSVQVGMIPSSFLKVF